ncbi:uncharacterized protein F4822DRAFT_441601 [Hypoxylon trugodes]|uniref:uncharacterized protein n=1 Tax=Hypoxylon trugodes TaxID=326681 RepID=UPI00219A88E9|nr:uncharacterized protein F4822DRAFT_441601 [Hypoxylon trugodes]KAI1392785.1 hypothetical protein F4822DRAFT_441601 [Hypoxylon trugodes]
MEPESSQSQQPVTVVDTHYLHDVFEHFDERGRIIDDKVRFSILCRLCGERNLAITNSKFDKKSPKTHEPWGVLPNCGHGFGLECLYALINTGVEVKKLPGCPTCHTPIFAFGRMNLFESVNTKMAVPLTDENEFHQINRARKAICSRTTPLDKMIEILKKGDSERVDFNRKHMIDVLRFVRQLHRKGKPGPDPAKMGYLLQFLDYEELYE